LIEFGYNDLVDFIKANQSLVELAEKYQHITYRDVCVPVPYFINTAEQIYKQAMKDVGIEGEAINKVIQLIKGGKTPLGSGGGKGSPEEITQDLTRLMHYLSDQGYHPTKPVHVRGWMTEMHIGLDCAGYVYNILDLIEKSQGVEILKALAWVNPEDIKRSHAGAFIYDSENLEEIRDYGNLKPLDIIITKDHTHVGIFAEYQNELCLTDCSMGKNGITFSKIVRNSAVLTVEEADYWNKVLNSHEVIIRRLTF